MKNSSRLELKMARNFTRSSKGTLGSCASSSTRRLNSSHDSSRLTNASEFTQPLPRKVSRRSARSSRGVGGSWRTNGRVVRTAPSGRLAIDTTARRRTRLSWRLAPPRSTTSPLLNDKLSRAASTPSRASSRALRTCTSMPSSRRSGSSSRSRFSASRTADVATATMRGPRPFGEYRAKKRCTARRVSSIAARGRVPEAPPPRRVGTRSSTSTRYPVSGVTWASIRRTAVEPRSTTATSSAISGAGLRCSALGWPGETPEDARLEEPAEPPAACGTVGKVHQGRAALLEGEPLALGGPEQAREKRPEERLVAHERDSGAGRMCLQSGNDSVDARVRQCWLDRGRDLLEGERGDFGGQPGAGKRARQQHVGPTSDPSEAASGHAELGLALGRERTLGGGEAGRPCGHRRGVADE